jgi:hypothetical protein
MGVQWERPESVSAGKGFAAPRKAHPDDGTPGRPEVLRRDLRRILLDSLPCSVPGKITCHPSRVCALGGSFAGTHGARLLSETGIKSASGLGWRSSRSRLTIWRGQSPSRARGARPCPRHVRAFQSSAMLHKYTAEPLVSPAVAGIAYGAKSS